MPEAAPAHILAVNNIEVVYNKTIQVLRGLSLSVERGKVVALLGSNGAGKSTTLKAVSNLLSLEDGEVTAGSIAFNGTPIGALTPHGLVRQGLFHVMEGRRIFEDLTVEENLTAATYALSGRGRSGHRIQARPFQFVYDYFPRLYERRRPRRLSLGRRAADAGDRPGPDRAAQPDAAR
jgi:branched-chain amino acid transport system ATP-binding protein